MDGGIPIGLLATSQGGMCQPEWKCTPMLAPRHQKELHLTVTLSCSTSNQLLTISLKSNQDISTCAKRQRTTTLGIGELIAGNFFLAESDDYSVLALKAKLAASA